MELQGLFPLALAKVQLQLDPWDLVCLMQEVLALRGERTSNPDPGCAWTGDINGIWQMHRLEAFKPISELVEQHALHYLDQLGFQADQLALHVQRSWPVVSEFGQVVGRHHHPNAHLSAVLYLNGDGSGRSGCLRLFPKQQPNELVPGLAVGHGGPIAADSDGAQQWNAPWFDLAPQAGLLVLFPAHTDHAVTASDDEEDLRLSLAFDLALTAPYAAEGDSAPPEYLAPHPAQWSEVAAPTSRSRDPGQ